MPNWCSNTVHFECDEKTLKKLETFFTAMSRKEKKKDRGQLPDFGELDAGWLFNIHWDSDSLNYETKWGPNPEVIKVIADNFNAGFNLAYDEPNMGVYGECDYTAGVLTDLCLDDEDLEKFEYDEENDNYKFEGETYDSDYEIKEILFSRKKTSKHEKK